MPGSHYLRARLFFWRTAQVFMKTSLTIFLVGLVAGSAYGQLAPPPKAVPTAEAILDRFTRITGGEEAYRAVKTEYAEKTSEIPGVGRILVRSWLTAEGDARTLSTGPSTGPGGAAEESGVYEGVAWVSEGEGPRILAGRARDLEIHDALMFPHELWRDYFSTAEFRGVETLRGVRCYKVRLTPKKAGLPPEHVWFSLRTGLRLKRQSWIFDAGEWVAVEVETSDYRKLANGLLLPHRMESEVSGVKVRAVFSKIEFDLPFNDGVLKYPSTVAKLIR